METLLIGKIHPVAEELLKENTNLTQISNKDFCETTSTFPKTEALVLRTFTKCQKNELDFFPKLKYLVSCSVGLNNLDLEEMGRRNIKLIHVPGTNANSVAEHTLYLLLSLLREDSVRPFAELKNKTVGIVGFGAIGKLVAKKLLGLECKIIAFDVIAQEQEVLDKLNTQIKELDEVLKADVITIHVPLNKHTQNLINKECFEKMKEKSFFINTSRAEILDEDSLLFFKNKFRGIALDVFSDKLKSELNHDNLILTKHLGAQGEESFREQCLKPVTKFLDNLNNNPKHS